MDWVKNEGVDAAAEHGHARSKETGSNGVVPGDEQSDGMDELPCYQTEQTSLQGDQSTW